MKVRADEIKVGDKFEGEPVVISNEACELHHIWFFQTRYSGDESVWHYRRRNELVDVERPPKLVTVTVELERDELDAMCDRYVEAWLTAETRGVVVGSAFVKVATALNARRAALGAS